AEKQYLVQSGTLFDRGSISFQEKDGGLVSAATLKSGYILAINPGAIDDPDTTYSVLSNHLEIEEEEFKRKARKLDDPYEEITNQITEEVADDIVDEELSGVGLYKERWRVYPGGSLAAHVLGYVGFKEDDFSGRYGIERYYNDLLERNTEGAYNNFFAEIFSNIGGLFNSSSKREADLVLTIEPTAQAFVEDELETLQNEVRYDEGGLIVMDPHTGKIVAMAALPTFDPGAYGEANDVSVFSNPFVEDVYEFGSIVKPLTVAAALDAGVLNEEDTFDDEGYVELDGERIENFDGKGRGIVPVQEILNQSLNTGAVYAMQELGRDVFREYMYAYGLNSKTDIDLPDEVNGIVGNLESSRDIEYATASFGQGVAVTPINMTRALATLANGGILVRPYVVAELDYKGYPKRVVKTEEQGKALKEDTSARISAMLTTVVDEALRDGTVALPNYSLAAKTGTAQIPNPEGGYYEDRFLHSFFGYFPSYDPEFLVFTYIVNPKEGRYASETLTDIFINTATFLINYYDIPPDR
ncbi:hypothetical protein CL654_02710, partial [bacterium]|nr:hypothetical protein [bacterium]